MTEWIWEPDDFAALWYSPGRDRFPFPLGYTSRLASVAEVNQHRSAVHAGYGTDQHELIDLAFHTLTDSQLRIEILGESSAIGKGTTKEYRVIGARTPHHAVMLTQTATREGVEERIRCRLLRPEQLPGRLSWIVPERAAGRSATETFHLDDLAPNNTNSDSWSVTPGQRFHKFVRQPREGTAWAQLRTGPITDRPQPWSSARWFDFTDDGRYLMQRNREHVRMSPAGSSDLTTLFTNWIDRALTRLREQEEQAVPTPWGGAPR
ncbi:ESX secretion-associated protein EspG [Nocardia rhizosphaerihabitans]|uniref:ESX secretion-associated protein EspG n=1 Tax=Nocardia rhizosphaerihabitans TaxID=1691570 RepID=UPI00366D361C